jgi:acetate kinase
VRRLHLLGVAAPVRGNRDDDGPISADGAAVPVFVIKPREELQLARDAANAVRRVHAGVAGYRSAGSRW